MLPDGLINLRVGYYEDERFPSLAPQAITSILARTKAPLVGASLDDLAGETAPVNIPGVDQDHYPSWTRLMSADVATIFSSPTARQTLAELATRRAPAPG